MRESGYYRVKREGSWQIAEYIKSEWFSHWRLFGSDEDWIDSELEAIDENRITPEPEININGTPNYIIDIKHVKGSNV